MGEGELSEVTKLSNAAFGALFGQADESAEPIFNDLLFKVRYLSDPAGCLVAEVGEHDASIAGCLIVCTRGSLGWFGPLAVLPEHQKSGVGAALVSACVELWRACGVAMMGLETFADSRFHVGFYGKFGFHPSWTGLGFERALSEGAMPNDVDVNGTIPPLDFLYPGLNVSGEAEATLRTGSGVVVSSDGGLAIVHLEPTFQAKDAAYIPFAAASSAKAFDRLLSAAEHLAYERQLKQMVCRTSGSSWATHDALRARGYRTGSVMVRMKVGEALDYDLGERYYLDNWL